MLSVLLFAVRRSAVRSSGFLSSGRPWSWSGLRRASLLDVGRRPRRRGKKAVYACFSFVMSPFVSSPPLWPSSSSSHPMSLRPMSSPPRLLSPPFLSSSRQHITYTTIGPHVHMALTYPLHAPRSLARSCLHFFCLLFLFSLFISVRSISILFCSFAHLVLGSYVRRCLPVRVRCGNNLLFLFLFLFMSGSGFGVYIIYTYTYNTFTVFFCFVLFPPFHPFLSV